MGINIYDPGFVNDLFENMSRTYDRMNVVSSFGFSVRWRSQCIEDARLKPGSHVVDLMSGMGETWKPILSQTGKTCQITAIDFCEGMIRFAEKEKKTLGHSDINLLCENVLDNSLPDGCADAVVSAFGLKTFSEKHLLQLAIEVKRILKDEGTFSFLEISVPKSILLKPLYMFYIKKVIPFLGKVFLGDPRSYRMLGIYTENFQNCINAKGIFEKIGLEVKMKKYFFGCATGLVGKKI